MGGGLGRAGGSGQRVEAVEAPDRLLDRAIDRGRRLCCALVAGLARLVVLARRDGEGREGGERGESRDRHESLPGRSLHAWPIGTSGGKVRPVSGVLVRIPSFWTNELGCRGQMSVDVAR